MCIRDRGDALHLIVVHTVVGIDGDDGILAKASSILLVDDRTARCV